MFFYSARKYFIITIYSNVIQVANEQDRIWSDSRILNVLLAKLETWWSWIALQQEAYLLTWPHSDSDSDARVRQKSLEHGISTWCTVLRSSRHAAVYFNWKHFHLHLVDIRIGILARQIDSFLSRVSVCILLTRFVHRWTSLLTKDLPRTFLVCVALLLF